MNALEIATKHGHAPIAAMIRSMMADVAEEGAASSDADAMIHDLMAEP